MSYVIYSALFIPLLGFLGLSLFAHRISRKWAGLFGCTTILLSLIGFLILFYHYLQTNQQSENFLLYHWMPIQGLAADFALHLDSVSLLMAFIITGIGLLIHIYSLGYMDHEEDYARYFACMNLFIFAMLLLVLASNILLLFVGWEGVGLASYLLIGFWYTRPAAAQAATKAFVINRIGDLGLLLGILLTFSLFGTGDIEGISQQAKHLFPVGAPILTALTLLYFVGAIGKSAQLPLFTWLPDAMEGPTPVSALIHAATMVTAGVYLLVRMHAIFILTPFTLQVVGVVGAVTSLFAALCALSQTDLKRVLAYSTISQLGLMFLACGAGAFYSAMFHLTTHAFIKALLFLSAGNVIHMLHNITEMDQMGGLAKIFTKTHWLFLIGVLALAGIPPFAAFFSKDLILGQEHLAGYDFLYYLGFGASILTGVYLMRAYCLTFLGQPRLKEQLLKTVKEAPRIMLLPVSVLAILSIIGGLLGFTFSKAPLLQSFLSQIGITPSELQLRSGFIITQETVFAIFGAFLGVGLSALLYTRYVGRLGKPIALFNQAFFVNNLYSYFFVNPLRRLAKTITAIIEPAFFEDSLVKAAHMIRAVAQKMQLLQSGQIRSYLAWVVAGSALLFFYLVL